MNIGLDLDGVLCESDPDFFTKIRKIPPERQKEYYLKNFASRKPLFDPETLRHEDDEYYILTARWDDLREVTEQWCAIHLPKAMGIEFLGSQPWWWWASEERKDAIESSLMKKCNKIRELSIKLYIDDDPFNVKELRKRLDDVCIIQYRMRASCLEVCARELII